MNKQEKELFKALCSFKSKEFDENLLQATTPSVLGHLFFNRMQAVAYGVLKKHNLFTKVNREFGNSLKSAYDQNIEKNKSFFWCVNYVEDVLSTCDGKYAMLKGAYLCKAYPEGFRTSNDIDLLVHYKDITKIGDALMTVGFKQGNVRSGDFIPATRKEIIESKMMRGETIPFIKKIDLPGIPFLEVDINFSLDYKPEDNMLVENLIENTSVIKINDFMVRTLKKEDFFVHLCSHLYKEATTFPWIEMKRDMTLYKYADIYTFLTDMIKAEIDLLFVRAKQIGVEKICAFTIAQMSELFNFTNQYATDLSKAILIREPEFMHTIVSPKENKQFVYTQKNIEKRFFSDNRKSLLMEV